MNGKKAKALRRNLNYRDSITKSVLNKPTVIVSLPIFNGTSKPTFVPFEVPLTARYRPDRVRKMYQKSKVS